MRELQIPARGGFTLAATLFETAQDVLLISSATAVPRQFYRRFAQYAQGKYSVLTYDYRGIGGSRPSSLRGFEAKMRDWALLDTAGVLDWVVRELSPRRVMMVGHSFGGQTAGLLENASKLDKLITLSAQSGYWKVQGGREKGRVRFLVTVLMPLLTHGVGYFPWSRLGAGEDLPKGVALEWARWCRQPNYLLDDQSLPLERYQSFAAPVLAYSIDDDDWGTERAVDEMMRAYPQVERRHVKPQDYGLAKLGHMGFFKPSAQPLWDEALNWLE